MSLPQLYCLNPYWYLMQKLFKETRSWATVLTTQLGVLNMHCRVGIAIPVPLHTCGLLANCIPVQGNLAILYCIPLYSLG